MILHASQGQHPDAVVRACVRQAIRSVRSPLATVATRCALGDWAPKRRDLRGEWIPAALQKWARRMTHYREPAGPGLPGEVVQTLPLTIVAGGGDCDDIVTGQAAMAVLLGIPAWIGRLYLSPDYSMAHVLCAVAPDWTGTPGRLIVDPDLTRNPLPGSQLPGVRWVRVTPGEEEGRPVSRATLDGRQLARATTVRR